MAYTTIDDPSAHFHIQLYSGTGSAQSITNDANAGDFQPDWVWVKKRAGGTARNHTLTDSSRGVTKGLFSSLNDAEATNAQGLTSFNSDGFSVGTYNNFNESSGTYVAWQWKANGGTTSSNSDGSITSTVQANTTAGFSIVTYTGTGSNATVGHGLGATPKAYIVKNRTDAADWFVYHSSLGTPVNEYLQLNSANAVGSNSGTWNSNPTSSVFGLGSTFGALNGSSKNYVAYVFAEKQGYSKIGGYTGNGNADGTFVYTGFRPTWIMGKRSSGGHGWFLFDDVRDTFNPTNQLLEPHLNNAETNDSFDIDILSNGFKLRGSENTINGNGESYVYMAFARHPFVSSKGAPTTAR